MQNCENCGGKRWLAKINKRTGLQEKHHIKGDEVEYDLRVWRCWRCGNTQEEETPFIPMARRPKASVLYLDLEVSKSMMFNYGLSVPSGYINPDDLIKPFYIICWSASYLGSDTVWSDCVTQKEAKKWDDSRILPRLQELMQSADLLAGHNLDRFDLRKANTRFLLNGIEPIVGKKTLDTLKIARAKFAFESNRLDFISQALGLRPKDDIRNADWLRIVTSGDPATLRKVNKYCRGDVKNGMGILERLMRYSGKRDYYGTVTLESAPKWLKGLT